MSSESLSKETNKSGPSVNTLSLPRWQYIESSLLVHYQKHVMIFGRRLKMTSNICNVFMLLFIIWPPFRRRMTTSSLMLIKARTAMNELKLLITNDDSKKMIEKLDNVCMICDLSHCRKLLLI